MEHDVAVITETKLDSMVTPNSLTLNGYISNRLDRNCNGGGVVTYCRDYLRPSVLCDEQDYAVALGLECTLTKIHIPEVRNDLIIVGVYRPPNAHAVWFDSMSTLV